MQSPSYNLVMGAVLIALFTARSQATEETIKANALPTKVFDALLARFPGMTFVSIIKETEPNDQVVYDVELKQKGRKYETDVKSDGTMLEVEKEVMKNSWPKALQSTVQSKFRDCKITEVLEVNKVNDKKEVPHHLEVTVKTANGKDEEVLVTLDGKGVTTEDAAPPTAAAAGDEDIKTEDLPAAVTSAVRKRFSDAKITSAEKGTEDGKPIFEASIKSDGHNIDVTLSPEGKILSFEKTLSTAELPKAMIRTLHTKYPHATIKLAEEVWEADKLTGYEVTIVTTDKKSVEVTFDPHGKLEDQKK